MDAYERRVRRLLKVAGTTYAEQAGIRLDAAIAVRAAKELFTAGLRTSSVTRLTGIAEHVRTGFGGDLRGTRLAARRGALADNRFTR